MTTNKLVDACPHCGDKYDSEKFFRYECGTLQKFPSGTKRTELCHQTEVSNIWKKRAERAEAEVKKLREEANNWHQHYRDEANNAQKYKQAYIELEKEVVKLSPHQEWRELGPYEEIQAGDEVFTLGMWVEVSPKLVIPINKKENDNRKFRTRRPLPVPDQNHNTEK